MGRLDIRNAARERSPRAESLQVDFARTMDALARGFRVGDIATAPIEKCDEYEAVDSVRRRFRGRFDNIPVQSGGRVIGVLQPAGVEDKSKPAGQVMLKLSDSMLIEESASLLESLESLAGSGSFRLVLRRSRVEAIVTGSDLLKLPVRALAFSVITQLERAMAECIQARYAKSEEWLGLLSEGRKARVLEKEARLKRYRRDPERIELTDICDKRKICGYLLEERVRSKFKSDLIEIEAVRNALAHGGADLTDGRGIDALVESLGAAQSWFRELIRRAAAMQ